MKKIIVVFSQAGISHHLLHFCIGLLQQQRCRITGLFLWTAKNKGADGYLFPNDLNATDVDYTTATTANEAVRLLQANVSLFKNEGRDAGLDFAVRTIGENHFETLLDETAFADLVLCDDELETPFFPVHNLIAAAHCPVMLVPEEASLPDSIIFAYDGTSSSIHAIKQFTYLFPFLTGNKAFLVSVVAPNIREMEYQQLAGEWMELHFPLAEAVLLKGEVKAQLVTFIRQHSKSLVVMGAFGRNALSRLLKESMALTVLRQTDAALFVTH